MRAPVLSKLPGSLAPLAKKKNQLRNFLGSGFGKEMQADIYTDASAENLFHKLLAPTNTSQPRPCTM